MENHSTNALSMRSVRTKEREKYTWGISKSRGRSKSPRDPLKRLCWKYSKPGHFKKNCRSKSVERAKGSKDTLSTEEWGDLYLASTST